MKKSIKVLILALALILVFAGCKSDTSMYDYSWDEYIELAEYKGIEVDTNSAQFKLGVEYNHYLNLSNKIGNVETEVLEEGTVRAFDTVNIDYEGKKDGVAFEGGTAEGYDLQIGSSSFIEGFEAGLLGAEVGKTLDLNLNFPENYSSAELAGKAVVFTVKVNSISRPKLDPMDDNTAEEMGYNSLEEYKTALEDEQIKNVLWRNVVSNSEIIMYPEAELEEFVEKNMATLRKQAEEYGVTVANMLSQYGMTEESFREYLKTDPNYVLAQELIFYDIAVKEGIKVEDEELKTFIDDNFGEDADVTKEDEELASESLLQEKVLEVIVSNAKIS